MRGREGGGEGDTRKEGETQKDTNEQEGKGGGGTGTRTGDRRLLARPATKPANGGGWVKV